MIFCYIDESGTSSIPGNSKHFVLAGIAIPISKWKQCENDIYSIKQKYNLQTEEIHTGEIIRAYLEQNKINNFDQLDYATRRREVEKYRNNELLRLQGSKNQKLYYKTKKNYRKTQSYIHLSYKERKQLILDIAKLIGSWGGFSRLFAECIDKIHFNPTIATSTIDVQAFEQLVSRFEQYLKIFTKNTNVKQYGLLIHDNNETICKKHTELMKSFHRKGTLWTDIQNIIETPLFVDSQLTSMVQIADVCSYSLRRYLDNDEDYLFNEIFKIADKKDGKVVGVRHFTSSSCPCKICASHKASTTSVSTHANSR